MALGCPVSTLTGSTWSRGASGGHWGHRSVTRVVAPGGHVSGGGGAPAADITTAATRRSRPEKGHRGPPDRRFGPTGACWRRARDGEDGRRRGRSEHRRRRGLRSPELGEDGVGDRGHERRRGWALSNAGSTPRQVVVLGDAGEAGAGRSSDGERRWRSGPVRIAAGAT